MASRPKAPKLLDLTGAPDAQETARRVQEWALGIQQGMDALSAQLAVPAPSAAPGGVSSVTAGAGIAVAPTTGAVVVSNALTNVTNDAQLKRAAADYSSFTHKSVPTGSDVILIEDAAAAGAKAYSTAGEIFGGSASIISPSVLINPRHYWRASNVTQSGGLVDTIVDFGRVGGKDFAQSGAARCPVATDGNGHVYLAPDGTTDYYQAGAKTDWKFLHNGAAWTAAFVLSPTTLVSEVVVLDTSNDSGVGLLVTANVSLGFGGFRADIEAAGGSVICNVSARTLPPAPGLTLLVLRFAGKLTGNIGTMRTLSLLQNGGELAFSGLSGTYDTGNSNGPLTLFRHAVSSSEFFGGKLYELWVDDTYVSDRKLAEYTKYAANAYTGPW